MTKRTRRRWHWRRITRDTATFLVGLSIIGYETVVRYPSDQTLVAAALLLMGFPAAWRVNDALRSRDTSGQAQQVPARGYYRIVEDEQRWDRERDQRRRDLEKPR